MRNEIDIPHQKDYEISYRTVPNWVVPAITVTTFSIGALAVLGTASYLVPIAPVSRHLLGSPELVLETFIRCIALLLLGFLTFLLAEVCRHDRLVISRKGLAFPVFLAPDLLFRRKRSWDDIANIMLGSMLMHDKKGSYEYELEEARDKRKLFIYFKSGGHACLDLTKMPKKNQERLFMAIEDWCISCSRAPVSREISERGVINKGKDESLTYTKLWEEELESHFSHTNFCPLDRGQKINNGRLNVVMQLASGGLSAVYLAEQSNKDLVIVKEAALPPTLSDAEKAKAEELFQREARLLLKLDHPQIARILDHFLENGRDYLVIEFVPGHTLRQMVTKRGPLDETHAIGLMLQLAGVLEYLHTQSPGVLHRDISPDNLVLRDDGKLVVIDFGAANEIVGTVTGTIIGKQSYMSPEQFKGKPTVQSDLYAAGCTLHYLLTGHDPKPLTRSYPQSLRQSVSDSCNQLVSDLTELEQSQRIESAELLIERIEELRAIPKDVSGTVIEVGKAS